MAVTGTVLIPFGLLDDYGTSVAVADDGSLVVAGGAWNGSNWDFAVARLTPAGLLDPSFSGDGKVTVQIGNGDEFANDVAINSFGEIVVAGTGGDFAYDSFPLVRLLANGALDSNFGLAGVARSPGGASYVVASTDIGIALAVLPNLSTVVVGHEGGTKDSSLYVFRDSGYPDLGVRGSARDWLDDSLNSGTDGLVTVPVSGYNDEATSVAALADSRFVISGWTWNGANADFYAARLNADGSNDTSFGSGGIARIPVGNGNDYSFASVLQSDGKLVLAGASVGALGDADYAVTRLTASGAVDASFGTNGRATVQAGWNNSFYAVAVQSDGKILAAGGGFPGLINMAGESSDAFFVARFNSNGTLDTSFGAGGTLNLSMPGTIQGAKAINVLPNGQIVVAGAALNPSRNNDFAVVRLNSNGSVDTSFGTSAGTLSAATSGADVIIGSHGKDSLLALDGNDFIRGLGEDDIIDGGAGLDTSVYSGSLDDYSIQRSGSTVIVTHFGSEGTDTLSNVERLQFNDFRMAMDVDGNAGQAYRLYQAAFNRTPDIAGLGFQMQALDDGWGITQIAQNFIDSPEFNATYGALDDAQFVTQLYANVLHRAPDAGGLAYHVDRLNSVSRAFVLVGFSESPENQAALIGVIDAGMVYIL